MKKVEVGLEGPLFCVRIVKVREGQLGGEGGGSTADISCIRSEESVLCRAGVGSIQKCTAESFRLDPPEGKNGCCECEVLDGGLVAVTAVRWGARCGRLGGAVQE